MDVLSDIRGVVRYNSMHKHNVPLYNIYLIPFGIFGHRYQAQGCYEGNVRSEFRFSEVLLLLHFLGYYLFNIIEIPSISWIQILRHIPFFKLKSEYLEYIL
jgi:hypothetical protein